MRWNDFISLWNASYIHIVDIRTGTLHSGDRFGGYLLPTNGFVLSGKGSAVLWLDGDKHAADGGYVLHGGKGQLLDIALCGEQLDYYLILYKARQLPPLSVKGRGSPMLPFAVNCGFAAVRPIALYELAERMAGEWRRATPSGKLYVKGLLYQFVYELAEQWPLRHSRKASVVDETIRYIQRHYAENTSLESIAATFNYSSRYLSKLFKRETGQAVVQFIIQYRVRKAQELLLRTDSSVQEIASSVGYDDLFYFIRIFKKHTGSTPQAYRKKDNSGGAASGVYGAYNKTELSIVSDNDGHYIDNGNENHYQYKKGEGYPMLYRIANMKTATLLLALTLLLSACTSGNGGGNTAGTPASPSAVSAPGGNNAAEESRQQAFPRTYVDSTGKEIVIENQPERVAVGHFAEMEFFFALGLPPVASPLAAEILEEFTVTLGEEAASADVVDLGEVMSPNLEKLLETSPDLIIGSVGLHEKVYDELSQIAPVVMLDMQGGWQDSLREYAILVGQEETAEHYIAELTGEINRANEALRPYRNETVGFFRIAGKNEFGAIGSSYYSYFFDTEDGLGLTLPEGYPEKWEVMSFEGLTEMNPDHLVLLDYTSSYGTTLQELEQSAVWQSLSAVQQGNVHFLDMSAATNGPYAVKYAVGALVNSFTGHDN